jgi:squalene-hopene/tetraprenyl-beta-curcumene cyclase
MMPLNDFTEKVRQRLLDERAKDIWVGELASSALSTAVAVVAFYRAAYLSDRPLVEKGIQWLVKEQLSDGSWGDTSVSIGNISTTVLAWAACGYAGYGHPDARAAEMKAAAWLKIRAGGLEPHLLVQAIEQRYGDDRTFAVPILTLCAIAGKLGKNPWRYVRPLPFEFAAFPRFLFRFLNLQVVSYALPALIAVGQARFARKKPLNPLSWIMRTLTRKRTLRRLQAIQPSSGGYLEAIPLTGFVAMSLVEAGERDHVVVKKCLSFLRGSMRADGSWPIDINLSTWVTTLSLNALLPTARNNLFSENERDRVVARLLQQQGKTVHPYTGAAAGAWAWTNLPGGVPDADDTAGALIALWHLQRDNSAVRAAAENGLAWLIGVQNRDGGIPTFCRGWGALEFDRSAPDLTAHALHAFLLWRPLLRGRLRVWVEYAQRRALNYLIRSQRADGSWVPLWFGNQYVAGEVNPTYATARVLSALRFTDHALPAAEKARAWLIATQLPDGGWGGGGNSPASIEETGLAVEALSHSATDATRAACARGVAALQRLTQDGTQFPAAPIGFYFAKLWYFERLYPYIFCAAAVSSLQAHTATPNADTSPEPALALCSER